MCKLSSEKVDFDCRIGYLYNTINKKLFVTILISFKLSAMAQVKNFRPKKFHELSRSIFTFREKKREKERDELWKRLGELEISSKNKEKCHKK